MRSRWILAAFLALLALLLLPTSEAHARPIEQEPAAGQRLLQPPLVIHITFSEPINARSTVLELFEANGTRLPTGPVQVEDRNQARINVALDALDAAYLVRWSTYSLVDGHRMAGSWSFAVGNATPLAVPNPVESPLEPSRILARAAAYVGLCGFVGLTIAELTGRRISRYLPTSAVSAALLFGGGALLFLQAIETSALGEDPYAQRILLQWLLSILLCLTLILPAGRTAGWSRLFLLIGWTILQGLSSHAASAHGVAGALLTALHLCLAIVWIGCVAALWLGTVQLPGLRRTSRAAAVAATGTVVTGVLLLLSLTLGTARTFPSLPLSYLLVFLYKMAAVAGLLALGGVNQFIHIRRFGAEPQRHRLLHNNLRRELVNALVVLLLAAVLSTLDPELA